MTTNRYRSLQRIIPAAPAADGDGVKIQRIAGREVNVQMDPFLLLDEIRSDDSSDYIGGFPPHPHRGFETLTYMFRGKLRHRDHLGNQGLLEDGGVQYMTAGRGIIHSEMPQQTDGLLHGIQLWLNLPAACKMQPPRYQDFPASSFSPRKLATGGSWTLLAGVLNGATGPIDTGTTAAIIADIALTAGEQWQAAVSPDSNVLVYVVSGSTTELAPQQLGIYPGDQPLQLTAGNSGARILLLAGRPLREPIRSYGPFVMNTQAEIEQAILDYQQGRLTE